MRTRRAARRGNQKRWYGALGFAGLAVIGVIAYVSYTANLGLPLQGRYVIKADVPDADHLIPSADVRTGGVLVGEVLSVTAEPPRGGRAYTQLKLALDPSVGQIPADSTIRVRPASVLGLTYVDLHLGTSVHTLASQATLPLAQARQSSDLTDLFQIFNDRSARTFQSSVTDLATGLAGRGSALNATIGAAAQLAPRLESVSSTLAAGPTRLPAFISAYDGTLSELSPLAAQLGGLVSGAATTLGALARSAQPLGQTIDDLPGAESATATAFTHVRPALDGLAQLVVNLRPAGTLLPGALQQARSALNAGIRPLRELPGFAVPLGNALGALRGFAVDPSTTNALRKLHDLAATVDQDLGPAVAAQVHCNVISLWGQGLEVFGAYGFANGPTIAGLMLQGVGAPGETFQNARPAPTLESDPAPVDNAQQCQSGNESWAGHQELLGPPGTMPDSARATVPPPGVHQLAQHAGLLKPIAGAR